MSDDINDLPVLEIAAKVVEHNDYLVSIDALLNGDERVMGKLARALLAATAECERMRAVLDRLKTAASNAADLLEARTDKPMRVAGAGFVRREIDAALDAARGGGV